MKPFIVKTGEGYFDIEVSIDDGVLMLCLKNACMQKQSYRDFIESTHHDKTMRDDARKAIKVVDLMGFKYKTHVKRENVVLELTPEQADALFTVFQHVGGDPLNSRRRYADDIFRMLEKSGAIYNVSDTESDSGICFIES